MSNQTQDRVIVATSAARTTAQTFPSSGNFKNDGASGVLVYLDVTVASGLGGLTLSINANDPASGKNVALLTASAAVTATGTKTYEIYPSGGTTGAGVTQISNFAALPSEFNITVAVGDASSYTYTIGYELLT